MGTPIGAPVNAASLAGRSYEKPELETRLSDTRDLDETVSGLERWANDLDSQGGGFREAATYLQVVIAEIITREFESGNEAARIVED